MKRHLPILLLVAAAVGCDSLSGPSVDALDGSPSTRKWNKDASSDGYIVDSFSDTDLATATDLSLADTPENTIEHDGSAPSLNTYQTSFNVVVGQQTLYQLNYQKKGREEPFIAVVVPAAARLLKDDGTWAAPGETVAITVEVDPNRFLVHFGPHGSRFVDGEPASLTFFLKYAKLQGINVQDLDVWYQPEVGETWTPEDTMVDGRGLKLTVYIRHFSNYAVAF